MTVESFKQEIVEALKAYDKYIVCLDKTPEECEGSLVSLMEKAIKASASDIEKGEGIAVALGKHPVFPPMIIRMITAGEQTGKLESMLERISDFLDEEIETTLNGLTSLIEPLLIVFLGMTAGGLSARALANTERPTGFDFSKYRSVMTSSGF